MSLLVNLGEGKSILLKRAGFVLVFKCDEGREILPFTPKSPLLTPSEETPEEIVISCDDRLDTIYPENSATEELERYVKETFKNPEEAENCLSRAGFLFIYETLGEIRKGQSVKLGALYEAEAVVVNAGRKVNNVSVSGANTTVVVFGSVENLRVSGASSKVIVFSGDNADGELLNLLKAVKDVVPEFTKEKVETLIEAVEKKQQKGKA